MRSDIERHSQRRCARRRPLRQPTARHAIDQHDCSPISAAAVRTTVTLPAAAPHHAMRSDLGRCSQRRRASRRPLRQPTARHAMTQHDCSPVGAAAVPTTVTLPAAASHHAMRSDLGRYSQRRRASRRPLRQQTARHAMPQHDCSPVGAAAVPTTVTLPAAAPNYAMRSDLGHHSQRRCAVCGVVCGWCAGCAYEAVAVCRGRGGSARRVYGKVHPAGVCFTFRVHRWVWCRSSIHEGPYLSRRQLFIEHPLHFSYRIN